VSYPRPKKGFGQNFLVDRSVLERIVAAVQLAPDDRVLEIGPGRGALTRLLAAQAGRLVAVELDRQLVPLLTAEFADMPRVTVIEADILAVDLPALLNGGSWKVAANLPYNISSQVLFRFLEFRQSFSRLVVMLQREVGERLLAGPGGKEYGILSVLFPMFFAVRREFPVRPGSFHPVPKVESLVLSFVPLPEPCFPLADEALFRRLVRAAFGQRRKTLWNCLRGAGFTPTAESLRSTLAGCGIDPGRRGETLDLREYALLANALTPTVEP
jgi:16S rRNA (adenine1518-N6/adenine1519-N6)-dimethyltransferase